MIMIGVCLIILGIILIAASQAAGRTSFKGGGFLLIGPIPLIIIGRSLKLFILLMIAVMIILLFMILSF